MKEFKTVKDILDMGSLANREKMGSEYVNGKWIRKPSGVFEIEGSFAKEGELLSRNLQQPLLFALSSGPIVLFAFKIRVGMAMFKMNAIQEWNFSSRAIERVHTMKQFVDQVDKLRACAIDKIDMTTTDFNTQMVMAHLK